jgi:hypothetical protein
MSRFILFNPLFNCSPINVLHVFIMNRKIVYSFPERSTSFGSMSHWISASYSGLAAAFNRISMIILFC